jgi:hypothetical protein
VHRWTPLVYSPLSPSSDSIPVNRPDDGDLQFSRVDATKEDKILTLVLILSMASTTQSAPSNHFSPSAPFLHNPTWTSILNPSSSGTRSCLHTRIRRSTHFAHGAIFFKYLLVASTFEVPTSSRVAAACRLRDDNVVRSNCLSLARISETSSVEVGSIAHVYEEEPSHSAVISAISVAQLVI